MGGGSNRIKLTISMPSELLKPPIIHQSGGGCGGGGRGGGVVSDGGVGDGGETDKGKGGNSIQSGIKFCPDFGDKM